MKPAGILLLCLGLLPGPVLIAWSLYAAARGAREPAGMPLAVNVSFYGLPVAALGLVLLLAGIWRSWRRASS